VFSINDMCLEKDITLKTPSQIREELSNLGISISEWARARGYSPGLVHQVLSGRLRCSRGQAHEVAVSLGLKKGKIGSVRDLSFWDKKGESPKETVT